MRQTIAIAAVAMLLLAGCAGLAGNAPPSSPGGAPATGGSGAGVGQQGGPGQAGSSGSCDYTSVYDRTIDSVVAVQANGGLGSGFVYRTDAGAAGGTGTAVGTGTSTAAGTPTVTGTAYVVTNAHVVGDADSVLVQFAREESRPGTVVGRDRYTDLAVIRVDRAPGYADALAVADAPPVHGEPVAALGNPFGLEETITHGIVSGLNRSMPTQSGFAIPNVVQTDAPISPGNSGGPLVTCEGTVVGVTSAGISAQGAENIGFAISPTMVRQVVPTLIERGAYDHAYLGVSTAPLTPPLVAANDLGVTRGVYVHRVVEGGPASGALSGSTGTAVQDGTEVPVGGDVIVAIDGRPIGSGEDLSSYLVTETRPGETVTITVVRGGERADVDVTLGTRPQPPAA
jgi:S1-C subfamily serine protease